MQPAATSTFKKLLQGFLAPEHGKQQVQQQEHGRRAARSAEWPRPATSATAACHPQNSACTSHTAPLPAVAATATAATAPPPLRSSSNYQQLPTSSPPFMYGDSSQPHPSPMNSIAEKQDAGWMYPRDMDGASHKDHAQAGLHSAGQYNSDYHVSDVPVTHQPTLPTTRCASSATTSTTVQPSQHGPVPPCAVRDASSSSTTSGASMASSTTAGKKHPARGNSFSLKSLSSSIRLAWPKLLSLPFKGSSRQRNTGSTSGSTACTTSVGSTTAVAGSAGSAPCSSALHGSISAGLQDRASTKSASHLLPSATAGTWQPTPPIPKTPTSPTAPLLTPADHLQLEPIQSITNSDGELAAAGVVVAPMDGDDHENGLHHDGGCLGQAEVAFQLVNSYSAHGDHRIQLSRNEDQLLEMTGTWGVRALVHELSHAAEACDKDGGACETHVGQQPADKQQRGGSHSYDHAGPKGAQALMESPNPIFAIMLGSLSQPEFESHATDGATAACSVPMLASVQAHSGAHAAVGAMTAPIHRLPLAATHVLPWPRLAAVRTTAATAATADQPPRPAASNHLLQGAPSDAASVQHPAPAPMHLPCRLLPAQHFITHRPASTPPMLSAAVSSAAPGSAATGVLPALPPMLQRRQYSQQLAGHGSTSSTSRLPGSGSRNPPASLLRGVLCDCGNDNESNESELMRFMRSLRDVAQCAESPNSWSIALKSDDPQLWWDTTVVDVLGLPVTPSAHAFTPKRPGGQAAGSSAWWGSRMRRHSAQQNAHAADQAVDMFLTLNSTKRSQSMTQGQCPGAAGIQSLIRTNMGQQLLMERGVPVGGSSTQYLA